MIFLLQETRAILPVSARGWGMLLLVQTFIWGVFGVAIPLQKGLEFFDPMVLTAYACLGCVFAIPVMVRALPENTLPRVLSRVLVASVYGELMALGLLGLGVFTVYWSHRNRVYFSPEWGGVRDASVFGVCLTVAAALAGAWLTLALSDSAAKFLLRIILIGALVAFLFQGRALPDVVRPASGLALAVAVLFFVLLRRELRRRTG